MTVTGDLRTAAGLLLATIGLVFSAWYPEMTAAIELDSPRHRVDRDPQIAVVQRALLTHAVPLLIAVLILLTALAPVALSVISHSLTDEWGDPYDPVRAIFVCVWALIVAMVFAIGDLVRRLTLKLRRLRQQDSSP
jgi:uncharacterized BrkB/YihY/UPF0761 family membrane protein